MEMCIRDRFNVEHIALANWADAFLVAPATANILAKMTYGIAERYRLMDFLWKSIIYTEDATMRWKNEFLPWIYGD